MDGVDCDVIIVGAGTAGCYLAKQLVKSGLDVRILEQSVRTKIDSGIVSAHFFERVPDRSLIKARIKAMDLVASGGTKINIRSEKAFAFLLNRGKLGKKMRAGIRSRIIAERFVDCERHKGWVDVAAAETNSSTTSSVHHYSCKVLVGADGAMSAVRKALGIKPPEMAWGLIDSAETRGRISVYFNKKYSPDGFAWRIPQSSEIGVLSSTKPAECFANFAHDMGKEKLRAVGGSVPIGTCKSYSDRAILLGDAAGHVKPLTGGGIVWGLRCADIAARAVTYAFDAGRFDSFFWKTEYERRWQREIGAEIRRQMAVRNLYSRLSNAQVDRILEIIKPRLERAGEFDYDALSGLVKALPKFSIARILAQSTFRLFRETPL